MTDRSVPIQLDRLRHLRFTFTDLADMQAITPHIFEKDMGDFSVLRMFLWAGLRHEDDEMRPYPAGVQKISEIIEAQMDCEQVTFADLVQKCTEAMQKSATIASIERAKKARAQKKAEEEGAPSKNSQETGSPPSSQ